MRENASQHFKYRPSEFEWKKISIYIFPNNCELLNIKKKKNVGGFILLYAFVSDQQTQFKVQAISFPFTSHSPGKKKKVKKNKSEK